MTDILTPLIIHHFSSIEEFGKGKVEDWFTELLGLQYRIPAHDTFGDVFAAIDSKQFSECFTSWVPDLANLTGKEVIAIDGMDCQKMIAQQIVQ